MKMNTYLYNGESIDSVELKCLLVSRGLIVSPEVYQACSKDYRLNASPMACNCLLLSDRTIVQLTDLGNQLKYMTKTFLWDETKLSEYSDVLGTPFYLKMQDDKPALYCREQFLDFITFPPHTDFYRQVTSDNIPFIGNAVLQGLDWVAFQCLWPCEYAIAGKPCQFCFSGAEFQTSAEHERSLPKPLPASALAEIIRYGMEQSGCCSVQLTGGSTFRGETEAELLLGYLKAMNDKGLTKRLCELLMYITPPQDLSLIDRYFALGAGKIACSLELWNEEYAKIVTPGKMEFTTRERHLTALQYISDHYGAGKAFSNFIIGIEPLDSLKEGTQYLAERGIIPSASVWMPMGRPVMGNRKPPDVDFYRAAKEWYAELYTKYNLTPAGCSGLNVCIEKDIFRYKQII